MAATLFQACQQGKLQEVREILDENKPDLETKDARGLTALMYAAQGGNVAIVQELLSRGARPEEASCQDFAKSNAEIASMLSSTFQNASTSSDAIQPTMAYDPHGGQQMPDGSISYVQNGVHPGQSGEMSMAQHQMQPYMYQPPPSFFDPTQMSDPPRGGHACKESSSANLPPPDIARLIPCKFFPNCRYGDKCLFAHPGQLASNASAGPVSPGHAPVFYQPPPSYGYSPYGPPQHFYSMAPPMPIQYAHAMPVHMPMPPHMAGPHVSEQAAHLGQSDVFNPAFHSQPQQQYYPPQGVAGYADADPSQADAPAAAETSAVQAGQAPAVEEFNNASYKETETAAPEATVKAPVHRRQSFNSFLHHHAIPFQPSQTQQQLNGDASLLQSMSQPPFTRGSKGPRRGGAALGGSFGRPEFSGSNKRADRPACYFFIRAVCKHGDECRFPHILPDGTDARGPNAGRPSGSNDAHRASSRALTGKAARNTGAANGGSSASAPTPPQAQPSSSKKANGAAAADQAANASSPAPAQNAAAGPAAEASAPTTKAEAKPREPASNSSKEGETQIAGDKIAAAAPTTRTSSQVANTESAGVAPAAPATGASASTRPTEAKATLPSLPANVSKPATAHNSNGSNASRANGQQQQQQQQQSQRPQVNGANGHKQGAQNSFGANGRPAFGGRPANGGNNNGRGNGQQQGQNANNGNKKVSQRVPNSDDFPALSNAPVAAAAPSANGAQKVDFSAILSAPAPVRKAPEPAAAVEVDGNGNGTTSDVSTETSVEKAAVASDLQQDKGTEVSADKSAEADKPVAAPNGTSAPDFATVAQAKAVAV